MIFIIQAAITFLVNQIAAFGAATDWTKVTANVYVAIDKVCPVLMQPAAHAAAAAAIDACKAVLGDTEDLRTIGLDAASGNWVGALTALEALLAKSVTPHAKVIAAVQALRDEHVALAA